MGAIKCVDSSKPFRLKILNLMNTGSDGDYREIVRFVVETANNRSDILPDYEIVMEEIDENFGYFSPRLIVNFRRQEGNDNAIGYYQAPIIIGPQYSSGCKSVGPIVEYLGLVAQTAGCASPLLLDHVKYHNIYLMTETTQYTGLAMLHFMRQNGWNQYALVTSAGSPNDYNAANIMNQNAMANGFTVTYFSIVVNFDAELEGVMRKLKASDARIIVVFSGTNTVFYKCLCMAYQVGITGPRYYFIATTFAIDEPLKLTDTSYAGCSRKDLFDQLSRTFFAGPDVMTENPNLVSSFGHTQAQFAKAVMELANSSTPSDEPLRFMYYDTNLKTLYALHSTEESLKRDYNMTLRDFSKYPEIVMQVANYSLFHVNISGLHSARMTYGKDGLPEGEGEILGTWSLANGFQGVALGSRVGAQLTFSNYSVKKLREITWLSKDGRPPKDGTITKVELLTVPVEAFIAMTVFAGFSMLFKSAVILISLVMPKLWKVTTFRQYLTYFGCIFMDFSAICFVHDDVDDEARWSAGIVLLVIGMSSVNGVLTASTIVVKCADLNLPTTGERPASLAANTLTMATKNSFTDRIMRMAARTPMSILSTMTIRNRTPISRSSQNILQIPEWRRYERKVASLLITGFLTINIVILISWLVANPLTCSFKYFGKSIDPDDDNVVIEKYAEICASQANMSAWMFTLTFMHIFFVAAGNFLAHVLAKMGYCFFFPELPYLRISLANSATLILATLLVLLVLPDIVSQQIALALGTLANSAVTSLLTFLMNHELKQPTTLQ